MTSVRTVDKSVREVDYSGCSASDLLELMAGQGLDSTIGMDRREAFCDFVGIQVRVFNRVVYREVDFVGLNTADKICLGMGLEISDCLEIIPAGYANSAMRMAEDEFWARDIKPSTAQLKLRAKELRDLREAVLNRAANKAEIISLEVKSRPA